MSDHKADALHRIEGLHDWQGREGETDTSILSVVLEAQVHATLYLAEQQRIANLIAFMVQYNADSRNLFVEYHEDQFVEITTALGIS